MNDQLANGEAIEDVHEIIELIGIIVAEPGLDRYLQVRRSGIGIDVIKKLLECQRFRKESRALAFRADSSGRTSEIKIHLPVTHCLKLFCRFDKAV